MRFRSAAVDGFQISAIAGVNTISFGITATDAARKGLLGFAVERADPAENERYTMPGYKVFKSLIPHPDEHTRVSTWDHPVQSFVWDDFTAKPNHLYEYFFHPLRGKPKKLDRSAAVVSIKVRTEPLYSGGEHDIFFNRGVASSQAYAHRFGNLSPDKQPTPKKRADALQWLSRDLDEAILKFIASAKPGDGLHCCFYEFRYQPVADALKKAIDKGVDVRIIVDAKVNESTDKKGVFHESFPREDNLRTIKAAKLPKTRIILRDHNAADIQHNKFMVRLTGGAKTPTEVWTGSTNISLGGIAGQTNVGHWVKDPGVAATFNAYWTLLKDNPGSVKGDAAGVAKTKKAAYRSAVQGLLTVPTALAGIAAGATPFFSPRSGSSVLDLYVELVAKASAQACITLAFGIGKSFKTQLKGHTAASQIVFMLLEKKDAPTEENKDTFVALNASNNVYKAWGSFIRDPLYQWTKETNAGAIGLNQHVSYIHSKFLLRDPLGLDPIVVTGSANFSDASTNDNDENMIAIRGNRRVADIYFTEFNRLFNHYYFRSVTEAVASHAAAVEIKQNAESLFLREKASEWLAKYAPGTLKTKRLAMYAGMDGFTTLP
jgi:phosphatidylserine/phosphatidylglycerophosphate/cardiolipin synthase-like enzyme